MAGSEPEPPRWIKSSICNGDACVEVALLPGGMVGVRNSGDPDGPVREFTGQEWTDFIAAAVRGEFYVHNLRRA